MRYSPHKIARRKRIEKEGDVLLATSNYLPEEPQLIYTPETRTEMFYFQKYSMMFGLAKSSEQRIIDLEAKVIELETAAKELDAIVERQKIEIQAHKELQKSFHVLCDENGGLPFESRNALEVTKGKLTIASKLITKLTGKEYPERVIQPITPLGLYD